MMYKDMGEKKNMEKEKIPPKESGEVALMISGLLAELIHSGAAASGLTPQEKEEEKKSPPRENPSDKFGAVIQADYAEQMDVLRWLQKDSFYTVVVALHDADTYAEDEIPENEDGKRIHVRKNPDGTESQFTVGDRKPAHYHLIVRTSSKIRAASLTKRFCGQVHFETLNDTQEYARYLTHSTFHARQKTQYDSLQAIRPNSPDSGWKWYCELMQTQEDADVCTIIEDWCTLTEDMSARDAALQLAQLRRIDALRSVMAHSYFYDRILRKGD